jgi:hypothetical protein
MYHTMLGLRRRSSPRSNRSKTLSVIVMVGVVVVVVIVVATVRPCYATAATNPVAPPSLAGVVDK